MAGEGEVPGEAPLDDAYGTQHDDDPSALAVGRALPGSFSRPAASVLSFKLITGQETPCPGDPRGPEALLPHPRQETSQRSVDNPTKTSGSVPPRSLICPNGVSVPTRDGWCRRTIATSRPSADTVRSRLVFLLAGAGGSAGWDGATTLRAIAQGAGMSESTTGTTPRGAARFRRERRQYGRP